MALTSKEIAIPSVEDAETFSAEFLAAKQSKIKAVVRFIEPDTLEDLAFSRGGKRVGYMISDKLDINELRLIQTRLTKHLDKEKPLASFKLPKGVVWSSAGRKDLQEKVKGEESSKVVGRIIKELQALGVVVYTSTDKKAERFLYHAESNTESALGTSAMVEKALTNLIKNHLPSVYNNDNWYHADTASSIIVNQLSQPFNGGTFVPSAKAQGNLTESYVQANRMNADGGIEVKFNEFNPTMSPALDAFNDELLTDNDRLGGSILLKLITSSIERMAISSVIDVEDSKAVAALVAELKNLVGNVANITDFERAIAMIVVISEHRGVGKSLFISMIGSLIGYSLGSQNLNELLTAEFSSGQSRGLFLKFDEIKIPLDYLDLFKNWIVSDTMQENIKNGYKGVADMWAQMWATTNKIGDITTAEGFDRRVAGYNMDGMRGVYSPNAKITALEVTGDVSPEISVTAAELELLLNSHTLGLGFKQWLQLDRSEIIEDVNIAGNFIVTLKQLHRFVDEKSANAHGLRRVACLAIDADDWHTGLADFYELDGRAASKPLAVMCDSSNSAVYDRGRSVLEAVIENNDGAFEFVDLRDITERLKINIDGNVKVYLDGDIKIDDEPVSLIAVGSSWVIKADSYELTDGDIDAIKESAKVVPVIIDADLDIIKGKGSKAAKKKALFRKAFADLRDEALEASAGTLLFTPHDLNRLTSSITREIGALGVTNAVTGIWEIDSSYLVAEGDKFKNACNSHKDGGFDYEITRVGKAESVMMATQ